MFCVLSFSSCRVSADYDCRVGFMSMPLILSAINFNLSSTDKEQRSRRLPLECLWQLMSQSRRVYDVTDFISTQTDDILHLAYLTSQEVFLDNSPGTPASASDLRIQAPASCASNGMQLRKGRAKNWHDAFLRHTRAYLLLATTVDYSMSVGRLPSNNALPELVCIIPPLGKIRLPWLPAPRIKARPRHTPASKEEGIEELPSPDTVAVSSTIIPSAGTGSNPTTSITHLGPGDGQDGSARSSYEYDQSSHSQVNLDYLDLNDPVNLSLIVDKGSQLSLTAAMEHPSSTSHLWHTTDMNASCDTYLHGLEEGSPGTTALLCS